MRDKAKQNEWRRVRYRSSPEYKRKVLERLREWRKRYPEKRNASNRRCTARRRLELLVAYGKRCECCGETELRFLTLEHKNHDGSKDRRVNGNVYIKLKRLGWPRDGYGLLCMNCNFAEKDGLPCPHKEKTYGIQ